MLIGGIVLTAAFTLAALEHGAIWLVGCSVALAGSGIGFLLASIANALVSAVPAARTAEALSTNTIARTIGSSIGTAVIAAALSAPSSSGTDAGPTSAQVSLGFWISTAAAAAAVVVTLLMHSSTSQIAKRLRATCTYPSNKYQVRMCAPSPFVL
jgi:hypothetical protein